MTRRGSLGGRPDDKPKVCSACGQWPAPIRPDHKHAYCEQCAKEVQRAGRS